MNVKTKNHRTMRAPWCGFAVALLMCVSMVGCTDSGVTDESLGLQTLLAAAGENRELERGDHDGRNKPYAIRDRESAGLGELNQVWFEATAGAEGDVLSQGAGQVLELECVSFGDPVQCEWTVQMLLSSIEPLSSWDAGLFAKAGEESGLQVLGFNYDLTQFTTPSGGETFGPPPGLLVGTAASTPDPAGVLPGTYMLVQLSLRLDFDGVGVGQRLIRTRIGELGWTDPDGNPPMIQFGDNAPVEASPGAVPADPTIVIEAVLAVEICDDGIDNDRDDLIDCDDPDCDDAPNCTAPILTCPDDLTVECDGTGNTADFGTWVNSETVESVCDNLSVSNEVIEVSEGCGGTAAAEVSWTATDDCGMDMCSATFSTQDTTAPSISDVENLTLECNPAANPGEIDQWLTGVTADDVCSLVEVTNDFDALSDECGETGSATVTWTATDDCGNSANTSAMVTVEDTTPPLISGIEDRTAECDGAGNIAEVDEWLAAAAAEDGCGDADLSDDFAGLSDDCGETGAATVTWTAIDDCGNEATASATFTVEDTTAPSISGVEDVTVECDGAGNTADLEAWRASPAVAEDACGETTLEAEVGELSDECGATGSAEGNWMAMDDCGNSSSLTAMFTIEDTTPPEITLNGEPEMMLECGVDNYEELGATGFDLCDGGEFPAEVGGNEVDPNTPSTYVVTYVATDACGNDSDELSRTVGVVDTTPPEVIVGELVELWPPNHKYRMRSLSDCAEIAPDACSGELDINEVGFVTSIYSDEPEDARGGRNDDDNDDGDKRDDRGDDGDDDDGDDDDGGDDDGDDDDNGRGGDGRTLEDIVILDNSSFLLRAERQGRGNGRVYGVTFEVTDPAGNTTEHMCFFGVPHDQRGLAPIDDGPDAGYTVVP